MKGEKLIVILICVAAILAAALFGGAYLTLKSQEDSATETTQTETTEDTAEEEASEEETTEITDEEQDADAEDAEAETVSTEDTSEMEFAATDDYVYLTTEANLRTEPSTESEIAYTLPAGTMLQRTGIGAEWSIVVRSYEEYYVSNDLITSENQSDSLDYSDDEFLDEDEDTETVSTSGGYTVVIDPGHQSSGDSSQEAIGPGSSETKAKVSSGTAGSASGLNEYELNLQVSLKLRDELESRGYTVYMTRESNDVNISNQERASLATQYGGDIMVRIHANGSESSSTSGALTMAPSDSNPYLSSTIISESQRLSQLILQYYTAATGFSSLGVSLTDTMTGINWSSMPVTIVEMGFMTNPTEDLQMADESMQYTMASGIADGIDAYFGAES